MQDTSITFEFKEKGIDELNAKANRLGVTLQNVKRKADGTYTASGKLANAQSEQAKQTAKAADAMHSASRSQAQYFAHIARTTVQSALINKLFLEFVDVSGQAIQQVDLMRNFPNIMAGMGQSLDTTNESLDVMRDYVGQIGGNLGDATSYITRFTGATGDVKAATAIYVGMNNALIAGATPAEEARLAMVQFAQALERGKPDAREWRSLTQNISFELTQVAKSMGYVNADALGTALTTGEESMANFSTALTKLATGTGEIAQRAELQMEGMGFAFNVMKNQMVQGLAAIINALGRSTIVSFFTFLTQVIQVLTSWVIRLIRAFVWLFNLLGSLFGLPAIGMQNETAEIADNINNSANNAEDLAGGLNDAGKEAKKLNKSLAGFDKMNVLPDKTSGSGSGGDDGGGGAGGFDPGQIREFGDLFGDIGSELQEISKWAKIFAGILAGIVARSLIQRIFGVDILDKFMSVGGAVVGFISRLPSNFVRVAKAIGSSIPAAFNIVKDISKRTARAVSFAWSETQMLIVAAWSILVPRIVEQFNLLKANIATILQKLGITKFFERIRNRVTKIMEGLRDAISNVFKGIKKRIIDPLLGVIDSIANIFSAGKSIISAVAQAVADAVVIQFNIMKQRILEIASTVGDVLKRGFEAAKKVIVPVVAGLITLIVGPFVYLGDKIIKALTGLAEVGKTIAKKIKSGIDTYVAPIVGPIAKIGFNIGRGIVESAAAALGPFSDVAVKAVKGMKTVFGNMNRVISPVIKGAFSSITKKMKGYGSAISNKLKSSMKLGLIGLGGILTGAFTLVLREGPEALIEKVNNFIQTLLNGPETLAAVVEAVKQMFATIGAQSETLINAVVEMVNVIVDTLIEYGPTMIQTFFDGVLKMINTLTQPKTIDKILTGTINLISNIIKGIFSVLPKILLTMLDLVVDLIEMITKPDMINMIIESTIDLLLKILLAMIDALPKIIDGMIRVLLAIIDVITRPDILDKIIDATIGLILTIVFALIDNIDKLIVAAVKLIVAIAKGLWDNRDKILTAIKDIGKKIIDKLGEVDWIQAGKDIVEGLWNGINNMKDWIIDKVKGFGGDVLGGLKSFFGIESPSKVMREEVGEMLGRGLAEGIEDSTSAAVNSAESAARSVTDVFKNMQTDVGDVNSDFSVSGSLNKSLNIDGAGIEDVDQSDYRPYSKSGEMIGKLITESRDSGKVMNLTVQIGEEEIASRVVDLINERTNMSGRNAIIV